MSESENNLRPSWLIAAIGVTAAAATMAAIVAVILTVQCFRYRAAEPMDSPQMQKLRQEAQAGPASPKLRQQLRQHDLALRQEYFRQQAFLVKGGVLLAVFLLLAAGAATAAGRLLRRPPMPPRQDREESLAAAPRQARWAVVALGLCLAGGFGILSVPAAWLAPRASAPTETASAPPSQTAELATTAEEAGPTAEEILANWPSFRGPGGAGVAAGKYPADFDGPSGRNILWKTEVPLPGNSSPVVWGNRVFLTGADEYLRQVYCFDAASGKLLWTGDADNIAGSPNETPKVSPGTGYAAPTAVTDGKHVAAIFANGDLVCFDCSGKRLWARAMGIAKNQYGHATSLAMFGRLVLVQYDQAEAEDCLSQLLAINAADGKIAWRIPRPVGSSWTSPIVVNTTNGPQLITVARPWVIAYDPAAGKELWRAKYPEGDAAPSPVAAGGLVFVTIPNSVVGAFRLDGRGDISATALAWEAKEGAPDIVSPAADGKVLLLLTTGGLLTCHDAAGGKKLWERELNGEFRGSPTFVGEKVYVISEKGVMHIFQAGSEFKAVATANLGEPSTCSPAFVGGRIYIRGKTNLFCIADRSTGVSPVSSLKP